MSVFGLKPKRITPSTVRPAPPGFDQEALKKKENLPHKLQELYDATHKLSGHLFQMQLTHVEDKSAIAKYPDKVSTVVPMEEPSEEDAEIIAQLKKAKILPETCQYQCVENACQLEQSWAKNFQQLLGKIVDVNEENIVALVHQNNPAFLAMTPDENKGQPLRGTSDLCWILSDLITKNLESPAEWQNLKREKEVNKIFHSVFNELDELDVESSDHPCSDCGELHPPLPTHFRASMVDKIARYKGAVNNGTFPKPNGFPLDFVIDTDHACMDCIDACFDTYLSVAQKSLKKKFMALFDENPGYCPLSFSPTCVGLNVVLKTVELDIVLSFDLLTNDYTSHGIVYITNSLSRKVNQVMTLRRFANVFSPQNMYNTRHLLSLIFGMSTPDNTIVFSTFPLSQFISTGGNMVDHTLDLFTSANIGGDHYKHEVKFMLNPFKKEITIAETVTSKACIRPSVKYNAYKLLDLNAHRPMGRFTFQTFQHIMFFPNEDMLWALSTLHKAAHCITQFCVPSFEDIFTNPQHEIMMKLLASKMSGFEMSHLKHLLCYVPRESKTEIVIVPDFLISGDEHADHALMLMANWAVEFQKSWYAVSHGNGTLQDTMITTCPRAFALLVNLFPYQNLHPASVCSLFAQMYSYPATCCLSAMPPNIEPVKIENAFDLAHSALLGSVKDPFVTPMLLKDSNRSVESMLKMNTETFVAPYIKTEILFKLPRPIEGVEAAKMRFDWVRNALTDKMCDILETDEIDDKAVKQKALDSIFNYFSWAVNSDMETEAGSPTPEDEEVAALSENDPER